MVYIVFTIMHFSVSARGPGTGPPQTRRSSCIDSLLAFNLTLLFLLSQSGQSQPSTLSLLRLDVYILSPVHLRIGTEKLRNNGEENRKKVL